MYGFFALFVHGVIYCIVMGVVFRARHRTGLGVFFCLLGTMHFLETYLAATFFIELPFGLISPGSTVMFTGKLAFFLLLYIKEDAEVMRQPIYGLLGGNVLMITLGFILRLYGQTADLPGYNPDFNFVDQMGLLMVVGSILLFIDLIALVIIYERLGESIAKTVPVRMFISLSLVLSFDQLFFYLGLHFLAGVPPSAFYGGWISKIAATAFFSLVMTFYLRVLERDPVPARARSAGDVFDRLTYRHRYEKLVKWVGKDALTGLLDRGQFDMKGAAMLQAASRPGSSLSLMMIDIDHFKSINDSYGHVVGDGVIRRIAETINASKGESAELFRYGGEEFALLCPQSAPEAMALADRIRAAVADSLHPEVERAMTVSIGIATLPTHAKTFPQLIEKADAALYLAKAAGRDRVVDADTVASRKAIGA